jgi:hypothetical protein
MTGSPESLRLRLDGEIRDCLMKENRRAAQFHHWELASERVGEGGTRLWVCCPSNW